MEQPLVKFDLLRVGHCMHPECIAMRGGRFSAIEFPALVGLIQHPVYGFILYDTGYSRHFMEQTRTFPECLYRMITPPTLPVEEEILSQLESRNIRSQDIRTIIISHFHGDHVAGLKDFPNARFISTKNEYEEMQEKGRLGQLSNAFLRGLIPNDFAERVTYAEDCAAIDPQIEGFDEGYDLLGEGSLIGIPLPGHARSQLGLVFNRSMFLVGDACWKIEGLRDRRLPAKVTALLFADNNRYKRTFFKLADLYASHPAITIIPSHCTTTWNRLGNSRNVSND